MLSTRSHGDYEIRDTLLVWLLDSVCVFRAGSVSPFFSCVSTYSSCIEMCIHSVSLGFGCFWMFADSVFQEGALAPLPLPPALALHLPLVRHTSSPLPAPLPLSIWHPTPSMWAAGRASCVTWACLSTPHVPGAHGRPAGLWRTGRWLLRPPPGHRRRYNLCPGLWFLPASEDFLSHRLVECREGRTPHWLLVTASAEARWMHMEVSWPLFPHPNCSMSCRQGRAPPLGHRLHLAPPLPPPTCSLGAIIMCSRAHITPFPFTILQPVRIQLPGLTAPGAQPGETSGWLTVLLLHCWSICRTSVPVQQRHGEYAHDRQPCRQPTGGWQLWWPPVWLLFTDVHAHGLKPLKINRKQIKTPNRNSCCSFFAQRYWVFQSFIIQNVWHICVSSLPLWHWWHQLFSVDLLHTCLINRQTKMEFKCYLPSKQMDIQAKNDPSNLTVVVSDLSISTMF